MHEAKPSRWVRWGIPIGLAVLGVIAGYFSWLLQDDDAWWSSALLNLAVVFVLLVPGEWAIRRIWATVKRIDRKADTAADAANAAKAVADRAESSLQDIRDSLLTRQRDEHEAELDVYREMVKDPSRDVMLGVLRHADRQGLISKDGVRVPVWETPLHYRFVVDGPDVELSVSLEHGDGEVISTHPWPPRMSAIDFYQNLVNAVREAGHDLGVGLNDPTQSVEEISNMLVEVTGLRAQELMGYRQVLRRIIERIDGWYLTEEAVLPSYDLQYKIEVERLSEMDWEEHLRNRKWYEAEHIIPFARAYFKDRVRPRPKKASSGDTSPIAP